MITYLTITDKLSSTKILKIFALNLYLVECITYRSNLECNGDIVADYNTKATSTSSPTFQSPEGYGRCASACIGVVGAIAFNWVRTGDAATCKCLSKVS